MMEKVDVYNGDRLLESMEVEVGEGITVVPLWRQPDYTHVVVRGETLFLTPGVDLYFDTNPAPGELEPIQWSGVWKP